MPADLLNQLEFLADRHGLLAELLHEGRNLVIADVDQDVAAFLHLCGEVGLLVDVHEDLGDLPAHVLRHVGRHGDAAIGAADKRSEAHTSELQSLMRISYAVFCLKKKKTTTNQY